MAKVGAEADKTVVLIHGLWVTTDSWESFRTAREQAGWTVLTPTWSVLDGRSAAALNASPPSGLGGLTVGRIVDGLGGSGRSLPALGGSAARYDAASLTQSSPPSRVTPGPSGAQPSSRTCRASKQACPVRALKPVMARTSGSAPGRCSTIRARR